MRKPGTGMALQAKKDFPEIEFAKSIIIGDSADDMDFGKRTNMVPVMVNQGNTGGAESYTTASLSDFRKLLTSLLLQHGE